MVKVFVAIHGIGDQIPGNTIRMVAAQLCRHLGGVGELPLGRISSELFPSGKAANGDPGAFLLTHPPDDQQLVGFGLGEVYWASIARTPEKEPYTLDEAKRWGQTVVERMHARDIANNSPRGTNDQYQAAALLLGELIEGIAVSQGLTWIADRMLPVQVGSTLDRILTDYVGDVQIVTEYRIFRRKILDVLHQVMSTIKTRHPDAEIYLVAHSEGSVIAFLGLMEALAGKHGDATPALPSGGVASPDFSWVKNVRGLMTIGSPIDTHLRLWPELLSGLERATGKECNLAESKPIKWRNYFDFGDPIGFRLDQAREWINTSGWANALDIESGNDIGFTRYYLPGQAHNDYWQDDEVFRHFFQTVAEINPPGKAATKPTSRIWAMVTSYVLPYILSLVILFAGVFFLLFSYKEDVSVCWHLAAAGTLTILLAGVTVAARLPQVARGDKYFVIAWAVFLACAAFAWWQGAWLRGASLPISEFVQQKILLALPEENTCLINAVLPIIALLAVLTLTVVAWWRPTWGARPTVVGGTAVALFLLGIHAMAVSSEQKRRDLIQRKVECVARRTFPEAIRPSVLVQRQVTDRLMKLGIRQARQDESQPDKAVRDYGLSISKPVDIYLLVLRQIYEASPGEFTALASVLYYEQSRSSITNKDDLIKNKDDLLLLINIQLSDRINKYVTVDQPDKQRLANHKHQIGEKLGEAVLTGTKADIEKALRAAFPGKTSRIAALHMLATTPDKSGLMAAAEKGLPRSIKPMAMAGLKQKLEEKPLSPERIQFVEDAAVTLIGQDDAMTANARGDVWFNILWSGLWVLLFFYCWCLAALLFDLTAAWHYYINGASILDAIRSEPPPS